MLYILIFSLTVSTLSAVTRTWFRPLTSSAFRLSWTYSGSLQLYRREIQYACARAHEVHKCSRDSVLYWHSNSPDVHIHNSTSLAITSSCTVYIAEHKKLRNKSQIITLYLSNALFYLYISVTFVPVFQRPVRVSCTVNLVNMNYERMIIADDSEDFCALYILSGNCGATKLFSSRLSSSAAP
jgi:hypothetical protein